MVAARNCRPYAASDILVLEEAMQVAGVRGVDADLQRLQPVARDSPLKAKV